MQELIPETLELDIYLTLQKFQEKFQSIVANYAATGMITRASTRNFILMLWVYRETLVQVSRECRDIMLPFIADVKISNIANELEISYLSHESSDGININDLILLSNPSPINFIQALRLAFIYCRIGAGVIACINSITMHEIYPRLTKIINDDCCFAKMLANRNYLDVIEIQPLIAQRLVAPCFSGTKHNYSIKCCDCILFKTYTPVVHAYSLIPASVEFEEHLDAGCKKNIWFVKKNARIMHAVAAGNLGGNTGIANKNLQASRASKQHVHIVKSRKRNYKK